MRTGPGSLYFECEMPPTDLDPRFVALFQKVLDHVASRTLPEEAVGGGVEMGYGGTDGTFCFFPAS